MAYTVTKHRNGWRIKWRKYEWDAETKTSRARERHIAATEYARLGITRSMTLDEVRAVIKKINAEEEQRRLEDRRNAIALRLDAEAEIDCVHLPAPFAHKFETEHLATRYMGNPERLEKVLRYWRTAQRAIRTLKHPMEKWYKYPEPLWAYFEEQAYSPGYVRNILWVINEWGDFLADERGLNYRRIERPNRMWADKIQDANDAEGYSTESRGLLPAELESKREAMQPDHFNWLYLTVWAGLRPSEVDALRDPKRTQVIEQDGIPVLRVFQAKLKGVSRDRKWKSIPLFLPEQQVIVQIIQSGLFKRPLAKTIASHFPGCTTYAGRKGFEQHMQDRGQDFAHISAWLGHQNINMTRKHYENRDVARWTPVKKTA